MDSSCRLVVGLLFGILAGCPYRPSVQADEKPNANPVEQLAPFVGGAWAGEGKFSGDPFRTKVVYEWGLNRRLLKAKSYLLTGADEKLVYETVYTWHPGKKQLVFWSIAAEGYLFDGTIERKGTTFEFLFDSLAADRKTTYRQTIEFLDNDHTLWTVHAKKGNDWAKVIESKQHREGGTARQAE